MSDPSVHTDAVARGMQLATRIADKFALIAIESEGLAEVIAGVVWHDVSALFNPHEYSAQGIDEATLLLEYAIERRLAVQHPKRPYLLRLTKPI